MTHTEKRQMYRITNNKKQEKMESNSEVKNTGIIIKKTFNYKMFKILDSNRELNNLHLKRLEKSFINNYLINPIIVNENNYIIDGQHRYTVARKLNLPIYFIEIPFYKLEEIQILNINQKNWNLNDYVDGYISLGKKEYKIYKDFLNKYKFPPMKCIEILTGKKTGGGENRVDDLFKKGVFNIQDLNKSISIAEKILSLKGYYEGYKRSSFLNAMITLFNNDNFDFDFFIDKLKIKSNKIVDCTKTKDYILLIEEIYNKKSRNKVNLRF